MTHVTRSCTDDDRRDTLYPPCQELPEEIARPAVGGRLGIEAVARDQRGLVVSERVERAGWRREGTPCDTTT